MMTSLCDVNMDTFWPRLKWLDFDRLPNREETVVVVPIVGFADWGLGLPLDIEETVSMAVLAEASRRLVSGTPHLVLPPLRFVLAPSENAFFGMDADDAHDSIQEIVSSVKASGFRKVVLYNASPWNEDLVDAAGRDLRIQLGMQMFCINLSGIGLSLMPGQGESRENWAVLGSYLLDKDASEGVHEKDVLINFATVHSEGTPAQALSQPEENETSGKAILEQASSHLARLLQEVHGRGPLPHDGRIETRKGTPL